MNRIENKTRIKIDRKSNQTLFLMPMRYIFRYERKKAETSKQIMDVAQKCCKTTKCPEADKALQIIRDIFELGKLRIDIPAETF